MKRKKTDARSISFLGLMLAFAMILSYVEILIPLPIAIPGVKLGLANLAIVMVLYFYGIRQAAIVSVARVILTGFLFGNLSMTMYSLAGAIVSLLGMYVMMYRFESKNVVYREAFSHKMISMTGGILHNMGQLVVAYLVVKTYGVFYYVPFLILAGAVTGLLIGFVFELLRPNLQKFIRGHNRGV